MAKAKKEDAGRIEVQGVRLVEIKVRLIGETPLFQNRMSAKVKQGLLCGTRKKTAAEKADIKHDPYSEFYASADIVKEGPTALGLRVVAIKAAMCDAAIETAGLTKTGTQRLLYMPGDFAPLYGIPKLRMDVTRSADQNRTPDIRTRAFLPKWGCEVLIQYVVPQLSELSVITLLANAGILIGVGDYRQQKGKGAFGSFRVVFDVEDAEWNELVATGGRQEQLAALDDPEPADEETAALLEFYGKELKKRSA